MSIIKGVFITSIREINALLKAMDELKLKTGLILTDDAEEKITLSGKAIIVKPVYKWLLEAGV